LFPYTTLFRSTHRLEALAHGHAHQESRGDPLCDDRELVCAERDVPVERGEVALGSGSVIAEQVGPLGEAILDGDRPAVQRPRGGLRVVVGPVDAEQADITEWIADG